MFKMYEIDEAGRKKMRHLAILLTKIARRLLAEEAEDAKKASEKESA